YVFAVFFITYYHGKLWRRKETEEGNQAVFTLLLSSLGTLALYVTFRAEIVIYWNQLFDDSMQVSQLESPDRHYGDRNLMHFRLLWTTIFTLFFAGAASLVNAWWFAGRTRAMVLMVFGFLGIIFFLFQGLMSLGALRSAWIGATPGDMFPVSDMFIGIRYVGWAALLFLLWAMRFAYRRLSVNTNMGYVLEAITHLSFLVMGSNEIVHWMDVAGSGNGEKMGVSVYWGLYALLLIVMGIRTGKQYQRIAALVIFGAALLKLFFYDLSHLDTISKTITLVVLGILLLLVSFLYYKFRNKLSE
ncbi:MAG: DUF2339 domain-containing protein, partial [Flavobacteriales bacterium]|nr:DUF2339 domain-containing protein [Flavobacteriales bacterium]